MLNNFESALAASSFGNQTKPSNDRNWTSSHSVPPHRGGGAVGRAGVLPRSRLCEFRSRAGCGGMCPGAHTHKRHRTRFRHANTRLLGTNPARPTAPPPRFPDQKVYYLLAVVCDTLRTEIDRRLGLGSHGVLDHPSAPPHRGGGCCWPGLGCAPQSGLCVPEPGACARATAPGSWTRTPGYGAQPRPVQQHPRPACRTLVSKSRTCPTLRVVIEAVKPPRPLQVVSPKVAGPVLKTTLRGFADQGCPSSRR